MGVTITNLMELGRLKVLKSTRAEPKASASLGNYVNHINGYNKLYKKGKALSDPERKTYPTFLPHLFLISDEFAELKQMNQSLWQNSLTGIASDALRGSRPKAI